MPAASGLEHLQPIAEGYLLGSLLGIIAGNCVLPGIVLSQANAFVGLADELAGKLISGGDSIIQHDLIGLDLVQLGDHAAQLCDHQIHANLCFKQVICSVRAAQLTAPAGLQILADGADSYKILVFC